VLGRGGTEPTLHQVALHGVTHSLGNDKTDLWSSRSFDRDIFVRHQEVNHHGRSTCTRAAAHRPLEVDGTAQSVRRGQHGSG
jgi:hypothetical protein